MDDVFLSAAVDESRMICISTISRRTYKESAVGGLGGDNGYFIYEVDLDNPQAGIEIIAKAASIDAAMKLYDFFSPA